MCKLFNCQIIENISLAVLVGKEESQINVYQTLVCLFVQHLIRLDAELKNSLIFFMENVIKGMENLNSVSWFFFLSLSRSVSQLANTQLLL